MRGTIFGLTAAVMLAASAPAASQTDSGMPELLRRSMENSRLPAGHGVAYTLTTRQFWDFGGREMHLCGEASYRFDPRAPRNQRFRNVSLEGDGRCQEMVSNQTRLTMRHGRPDIERVEVGPAAFGQPISIVREDARSVTYSVRIVRNENWNGMFGDEREPLSEERQRERIEAYANFSTEVTLDRRSARVLEMTQLDPNYSVGITSVRNMRLGTTYNPLTPTLSFPHQGAMTGEARALLMRINMRMETTYSDVELVRLNTPAPVIANAIGPVDVDARSTRQASAERSREQRGIGSFINSAQVTLHQRRIAELRSQFPQGGDPPADLSHEYLFLANAYLQVWSRQLDAHDQIGQAESLRLAVDALDNALLYRNAYESATRLGSTDNYYSVGVPSLLSLNEDDRALTHSRAVLAHASVVRALGESDNDSEEAVARAVPTVGWMAGRDGTGIEAAIAQISRARTDLIDAKIGRPVTAPANPAAAASLALVENLRNQIRAQRGGPVSGQIRTAFFDEYERLSGLLAPDTSERRLARVLQLTGAEAIAMTTFGATAPASSTIVYARGPSGPARRASATQTLGTRDDPVRRLLFGGDLPRSDHFSRQQTGLRPGRNQEMGGWIGALQSTHERSGDDQLRQAVSGIGAGAWEAFARDLAAQLQRAGVRDGARVLWIPSGSISFLPVGLAIDPATGRRLIDRYEFILAPSIDLIERGAAAPDYDRNATVGGVFNPTQDLPFAGIEATLIASSASVSDFTPAASTGASLIAQLGQYGTWHFAAHGSFDWSQPTRSGVLLRGGRRTSDQVRLTIRDVVTQARRAPPRLVVLSACETGLVGLEDNPDAFIGLPAAFLASGARGVVATLWPVNDVATALLVGRFYYAMQREGATPPAALRRAQLWLRDATQEELVAFLRAGAGGLGEADLAAAEDAIIVDANERGSRPYADP
jgi:CHAT domain